MAYGGAELHEGLVERSAIFGMSHKDFGQRPEFILQGLSLGILASAKQAGKNADHVSVYNRLGKVESDTTDGAGGITTDAGQGTDGFGGVWMDLNIFWMLINQVMFATSRCGSFCPPVFFCRKSISLESRHSFMGFPDFLKPKTMQNPTRS